MRFSTVGHSKPERSACWACASIGSKPASVIARLALTDFRNYAAALVEPGPSFVLLSGDNGAGKTNVLEAVSLLTPGRGLRGAALSEVARSDGPGGFAVSARLDGEIELGTGTLATAPDRRQVRINGAPASVNALAEWMSVLWLTPAMDRLFTDSAGARRRFLDRLVLALEPGHAHHAARYEAAMRARNKLLAEPDSADPAWLAALEAGMAEHGAALAEARARTVEALDAGLPRTPMTASPAPRSRWKAAAKATSPTSFATTGAATPPPAALPTARTATTSR